MPSKLHYIDKLEVVYLDQMEFLVTCGISDHVKRDYAPQMILAAYYDWEEDNLDILHSICDNLAHLPRNWRRPYPY